MVFYTADEEWNQIKLFESVKNDANGKFSFENVTVKEAGTYFYTVRERNGGKWINGVYQAAEN